MKKITLVLLALIATYSVAYAQQTLKWSVGEPNVEIIENKAQITYPLNVSIDTEKGTPILGTSTMRFFYDRNYLSNLKVSNVENGFRASGLNQSDAVFGDIFGFSNNEGVFAQFNIIDAAKVNPLYLKETETHVLDLSFEVTKQALDHLLRDGAIALPIVLDNNPASWNKSCSLDCGYLVNDSGIGGAYYLDGNTEKAILANDEVVNYAWNTLPVFDGKVDNFDDRAGNSSKDLNLEDFSNALSIKDYLTNGENLFLVYTTPFDKEIVVNYSFHYNTDVLIEIFDLKGALIHKKARSNYAKSNVVEDKMNLSLINDQVLLVRLTTDREVLVQKIINK
ncbi:hypothetical protein [Algibacter sp. 2305UL17-15]|uniref:hypothetical protein n=1 Tax=Algibacter sp. 2305UL17-15 TaxID=3231268 RepID=UPI0034576E23